MIVTTMQSATTSTTTNTTTATTTAQLESTTTSSSSLLLLDEDAIGIPSTATLRVSYGSNGVTGSGTVAVLQLQNPNTFTDGGVQDSKQKQQQSSPLLQIPIGPELLLAGGGDTSHTNAGNEHNNNGSSSTSTSNRRCILVGRQTGISDLRIQHGSISRKHAALFYQKIQQRQHQQAPLSRQEDDTTIATTSSTSNTTFDEGNVNDSNAFNDGSGSYKYQLFLIDLGGKQGTSVNNIRIQPQTVTPLQEEDIVMFGTARDSVFQIKYLPTVVEQGSTNKSNTDVLDNETNDISSMSAAPLSNEVDVITRRQEIQTMDATHRDNVDKDSVKNIVKEQTAGEGLTGRAKRQAEIQAMMATLDEVPVYKQYHHPEIETTGDEALAAVPVLAGSYESTNATRVSSDTSLQEARNQLQQEMGIPLTNLFNIPSESRRRSAVTCLSVDPTGSRFAVGSTDTHVRLYDFGGLDRTHPEAFRAIIPDDGHPLEDCCYSNTGDRIMVATSGVQPIILDRDGHEIIQFVRGDMYVLDPTKTVGHTGAVMAVNWHPQERDYVLTASADGSARIWNLNGRTQFQKLVCDRVFPVKNVKGQRTAVLTCCFHPAGRELAVGTACGSIQIWNRDRQSHRPDRVMLSAHGGDSSNNRPVTSVSYNGAGTQLASRSSSHESNIKIWDMSKTGRIGSASSSAATTPIVICENANTMFDKANSCFSPDGQLLCVGVSVLHGTSGDLGGLHVYALTASNQSEPIQLQPVVAVPVTETQCTPVRVHWHPKLNQIFVGCSDGSVLIWYDLHLSSKGVLLPLARTGRSADPLSEIIQTRAASVAIPSRDILTPFAQPKVRGRQQLADDLKKRKRQDQVDPLTAHEPERPVITKPKPVLHKGGGFTLSAVASPSKVIAGKDPRAALFQYGAGNDANVLADKTAEQEEEERKVMKKV